MLHLFAQRRWILGAVLSGGAAAALGRRARAADAAVSIDNFTFTPAMLAIPAGVRVVWTNRDDIPHTVTSADRPAAFRSGALDTGDAFSWVFDKPGTYRYFCALHPHMQGTVVVT